MAIWLKQSTAIDVKVGPFLDDTDGKTAETGLTITQADIRLAKNGGAFAQKNAAQTLTHEENGWYEVALDTTDTNTLGTLIVAIHESGALPVWREFLVVPAMIYDSIVAGSDRLDTNVTHITDQSQTARDLGASVLLSAGTGTGQLDFSSGVVKANLVQILATALTETAGLLAGGFKKFFNVATPTGTVNSIPDAVAGAASGLAIVGSNMGTVSTVTGNVNGNVGGNVTGSIGSLAAQAKLDVNAEVDTALNTAIPGSPTANSVNERLATLDDSVTATRAGYLDNLSAGAVATQASVDTVDSNVDAILADTGTDGVVVASGSKTGYALGVGGIGATAFAGGAITAAALAADAGAEIRDAVWAQAMAELSAVPGVTASVLEALEWVFTLSRNKVEQTATTQTLRKDDGTTALAASTHSDDGTTHTRGEFA